MARIPGFARVTGLAFGVALLMGFSPVSSAIAAPFGAVAEVRHENAMPIVDVQARRKPRRQVRRNRNGAAAAALIGAAVIGGAIIANSNRGRSRYYYDDPDYAPRVYRQPRYQSAPVYYEQPYYGPQYRQQRYYDAPPSRQYRQRRQAQPRYYEPAPGYSGGAPTVVVPRSQSTGEYVVPGGLQRGQVYRVVPGGTIRTEGGN